MKKKHWAIYRRLEKNTSYIDVLKPAETPTSGPGLYFMDTSSAAAECVTLQAAAGFVVHVFSNRARQYHRPSSRTCNQTHRKSKNGTHHGRAC